MTGTLCNNAGSLDYLLCDDVFNPADRRVCCSASFRWVAIPARACCITQKRSFKASVSLIVPREIRGCSKSSVKSAYYCSLWTIFCIARYHDHTPARSGFTTSVLAAQSGHMCLELLDYHWRAVREIEMPCSFQPRSLQMHGCHNCPTHPPQLFPRYKNAQLLKRSGYLLWN